MGTAARAALGYAWPRIAEQVERVYDEARNAPEPATALGRAFRAHGLAASDGGPRRPPKRLPSLDPAAGPQGAGPSRRPAPRPGGRGGARGWPRRSQPRRSASERGRSIVRSDFTWSPRRAMMAISISSGRFMAWRSPARRCRTAPAPRRHLGDDVGVLMSATLPARHGEPARALMLARRTGRMREPSRSCSAPWSRRRCSTCRAGDAGRDHRLDQADLFHSGHPSTYSFQPGPLVILVPVLLAPMAMRRTAMGGWPGLAPR